MNTILLATPDADSTRRIFLRNAGLFGLGLAATAPLLVPARALAATASKDTQQDIAILNSALALEYQGIAAYQVGAESGLLQKAVLDLAVTFQGHHKAHADILAETVTKLGGKPEMAKKAAEYGFPVDKLKNQADVLRFAAGLEQGAASAYLGAVPQFHNRDLARAAASILGDETMHWAILRNAVGEDPVPAAFIA